MKILNSFPIFKYRNYRLYFFSQVISFAGTWLQNIALAWLVLKITNSAFWVGVVAAFPMVVSSVLLPIGGILADKIEKRKLLYVTQTIGMMQAFFLSYLTNSENATIGLILLLSFVLGVINAVDGPTRNSFVAEIVPQEEVGSAAALNGSMMQSAQILGPGIAGLLITAIGMGWTFAVNGFSFLVVIMALAFMKLERQHIKKQSRHPIAMFFDSLDYIRNEKTILQCILLTGVIGIFGHSFRGILPVIARDIYSSGPALNGYMASIAGVGAVIGSLVVSVNNKKMQYTKLIGLGACTIGLALIFLALTTNVYVAMALLFIAGVGLTLAASTARAQIQILTEREIRGRVVSVTMMSFFAGMAIGNFLAGVIAENFGCQVSLLLNGIALLVMAMYAWKKES